MNCAVLCDLNSINISFQSFEKSIDSLDYKISYVKFYGYSSKRHSAFNQFIKDHNAEICMALQNRKKVRADIRQIIDSILLASRNNIDSIVLICSELDSKYMIQTIKSLNKEVVVIGDIASSLEKIADKFIVVDRFVGLKEKTETINKLENINDNAIEFLPYSSIIDDEDHLKDVKDKLSELIQKRKNEIALDVIEKNNEDIESLLKKYF